MSFVESIKHFHNLQLTTIGMLYCTYNVFILCRRLDRFSEKVRVIIVITLLLLINEQGFAFLHSQKEANQQQKFCNILKVYHICRQFNRINGYQEQMFVFKHSQLTYIILIQRE